MSMPTDWTLISRPRGPGGLGSRCGTRRPHMSLPPVAAEQARSRRGGVVLFAVVLFVLSVLLQYVGAIAPQRALGAQGCDSFAIFTTDPDLKTINKNQYASKTEVYLNGGPPNRRRRSA